MSKNAYESFFVNFANKTKLDIILSLKEKSKSVSEIVKTIGAEQSAVSHNLKKLNECKIVDVHKKGKERIYSLNKDTVLPMMNIVRMHIEKNCDKKCEKCGFNKLTNKLNNKLTKR